MKKVSIVVPVYKSEQFLPKLIDSILHQTYSNIELILVDDESPDNSGLICDEYAKIDERIIVVHQKNGGGCNARNAGLSLVTGDYLMFVDGDDWLELDCVEYLVSIMETNHCEMAMSDCVFTTKNRKQVKKDNIRVWTPERAVCGILYVETPVGPWNKLYTTSVVKQHDISFSVPWFGEGLYFSVTVAQYSNSVAVGHRKVYNYRLNNLQSVTTIREVQHGINSLWNIHNIKDNLYVKTENTIRAADWHISRNCFNLLWFILESREKDKYRDLYDKTRKEQKSLFLSVLVHSKISLFQKLLVIFTTLTPSIAAIFATYRRNLKSKQ